MLETGRIKARRPVIYLQGIFASRSVQVSMMEAWGIKALNETDHFKEGHRVFASRGMKASMMETKRANARGWPIHLYVNAFRHAPSVSSGAFHTWLSA